METNRGTFQNKLTSNGKRGNHFTHGKSHWVGGKFVCYLRHAIGQVENISFSGEILLLFGFGLHAYS